MVGSSRAPDAGEIVWLDFDPQAGREQAGHRPAVVLTPAAYNSRSGLLICVPLTTRVKGYPFEVPVKGARASVALVDHVRSIDGRARRARIKGRVSEDELEEIRAKLRALMG
ncbi:MAG TPA: endoribonuclease MazF [Allosphingosinicella sp.]|nr:endoribonuclease MazF [Allosphingosinicella sp.]